MTGEEQSGVSSGWIRESSVGVVGGEKVNERVMEQRRGATVVLVAR